MGLEHNSLKYAVGITRGLKRVLGLDDDEQGTTRAGETLQPVVLLHGRPEYLYPQGEKIFGVFLSQAATAAEFSTVGISNPADSGVLVVIEGWTVIAASEIYTARLGANVAFTATGKPTTRDSRAPNFPNTNFACNSFAHHSAAQIGSAIYEFSLSGGNVFNHWELPVVLSPGFFFAIDRSTVNTQLIASIYGRERPAFPGELLTQG